ncbi:uncharacterized protein LOC128202632 [Galleria mellonella]|uniref:Uncharacterized protein LOC113519066 n=1 Tax=Galleria mellonella TaxID=7137 RepID=A0A6J1WV12_GALME|nr:uncharacterized protein LOC113519066 [Galleria mellonella]XP_052759580.1 uncharacterized protein LOC128202632 [Galleria mellonella]
MIIRQQLDFYRNNHGVSTSRTLFTSELGSNMETEDNFVVTVVDLYKEKKWREIVDRCHDHPERNKLLWVFPSEANLRFLTECLVELGCNGVLSIGCGSGLLEWILSEATGFRVSGVEVDGAWWQCKYAPPTFIPLLLTSSKLDKNVMNLLLRGDTTALLFCYFNNRDAFNEYLKYFSGRVLIIIGPGDGKGVHTDPKPFGDVTDDWILYKWEEVRNSKDYIAVYCKNNQAKDVEMIYKKKVNV